MTEDPTFKCQNKIGEKKCRRTLKRAITGGSGTIFRGDGWSRSAKKDEEYNRDMAFDHMQDKPETDPYRGYRNWDEEK